MTLTKKQWKLPSRFSENLKKDTPTKQNHSKRKTRFKGFTPNELWDLWNGLGWANSEGAGGENFLELRNEILTELQKVDIDEVENWMWETKGEQDG